MLHDHAILTDSHRAILGGQDRTMEHPRASRDPHVSNNYCGVSNVCPWVDRRFQATMLNQHTHTPNFDVRFSLIIVHRTMVPALGSLPASRTTRATDDGPVQLGDERADGVSLGNLCRAVKMRTGLSPSEVGAACAVLRAVTGLVENDPPKLDCERSTRQSSGLMRQNGCPAGSR